MKDLLAKHANSPKPNIEVTPDDTALFQYSGGTTGVPKGAVAMHRNVVANTLQIKSWMTGLDDGKEVVLMGIPLFHVYGMVAGMNFAMSGGASMVMIPNARDLKDVLDNISKHKATIFPGVPLLYNGINNHPDVKAGKYDLSSIKACISGSAALMRETKEQFEKLTGGKVFEGYGLSEAPTATHVILQWCKQDRLRGMPLPDVDVKIISLDDGETEMPLGELANRDQWSAGDERVSQYADRDGQYIASDERWKDLAVHR
jgi:long-chain acyl-CoA synthetase